MEFLLRHIWKRQEEHASICIINTLFCFWKSKKSETELILYRNLNIYKFWDLNFFFFFWGGCAVPFPVFSPYSSFHCYLVYLTLFLSLWCYSLWHKTNGLCVFFFSSQGSIISFFMCAQVFIPHKQLQVPCQHKVITCFYRLLDNYSWHYSVLSNINV